MLSVEAADQAEAESPVRRLLRRPSPRFRREHPRELRHLLSVVVATICSWLVFPLPTRLRNWGADRVGDLWIRLVPHYRANVVANLGQVLGPGASRDRREALVRGIFRANARNFGDLLRLPHMGRAGLVRSVPLAAGEWSFLDDARAHGRGVVLLTAHVGAFDLVGNSLAARGYPLTSVTGRTTKRFVFDAVTHLRQQGGMKLVEATPSGVRKVIHALRRGELAAFLADYDFFENGVPVTLFGRETTLPPGPIRIARDTGAVVVGAIARRAGDGYTLAMEPPFEVPKTRDREADVALGMARVVEFLERAIGANPEQWVVLQRVWPESGAAASETGVSDDIRARR